MIAARTTLSLLLLAGLVAAAGCDGCAADPTQSDDDGRNKLPANGNPGDDDDDDDDDVVPEARDLAFTGVSPLDVFYGQQVQLPFTLTTASGVKVTGQSVSFVVEGQGGSLNVAQAATDANGTARVTFTAGNADATVTVKASAEHADDVSVTVRVKVNPVGSLKIAVSSQTRIPTTRAEVLVFRGPATNVPTCAYLDTAATIPTAAFAAELTAVPGNRTFTDQPHGQAVTVLASGYNAAGDLIGTGCSDGSAILGGGTTTVTVAIAQLPSVLAGDYDVLLQVDVGQALPEPYEGYVETVSSVLADPAGYAVYQALKAYDAQWWYKDLGEGYREYTYREVSEHPENWTSFATAQPIVDQLLANQLGQNYVTVTTVGGDIRQAITAFEVGSRFSLTPVDGVQNVYDVSEQWNDLVFTWRLGCTDGDLGCARRAITLDETNYAPVATTYAASSSHAPLTETSERFQIASEPHLFALRYGAIIMIAMNEVVFPSLPYQTQQGETPAHSLDEVLNNIIECDSVGQALADALPLGSASTYASACELGLDFAATSIENRVLQLEVGSGNPELGPKEQTGALGGGTLYLIDADKNLSTELVRELEMQVQWNDADDGASTDVLAPIVGEGREAASGCDADAACEAGTFCQPVASYLKVKQAEMTCAAPVGETLGEGPCTSDAGCASGLCVGDAQGVSGSCFSACQSDDACGFGVCTDAAAFLDLDTVMSGLGDASLSSCLDP